MINKANLFTSFLLGLMICLSYCSLGQKKEHRILSEEGKVLFASADSINTILFLQDYLKSKQGEGFFNITFNIDSTGETTYIYNVNNGDQYLWADLSKGDIPPSYLGNFAFEQKFNTGKPFSYRQVNKLFSTIIRKAENNGYPFARINFDSIEIYGSTIKANLNFNPGPYITFDSLSLTGSIKIKKKWLSAYLGVKQGEPFSQKAFASINQKVGLLPFVRLSSPPALSFQNDEATVYLDLVHKPANRFDAVIGFAPGVENDLLITGKVNVELNNLFSRGHYFLFNWRRIRPETQELEAAYEIPNVFNSAFTFGGDVSFFRQDTSFFNLQWQLKVNYIKGKSSFGVFTRSFSSNNIQGEDNEAIKDITINYFGVRGGKYNVNEVVRPTEGYLLEGSFAVGDKEIGELTGNENKTTQMDIALNASFYSSFNAGFLVNTFMGQSLVNKSLLFNDYLRTGGINSIRGFPESHFYVSEYYLLLNEYHWAFSDGSSFLILADGGILKSIDYSYALSFGLGFDLKVNNGIFELIYAIGKEENLPMTFDRSVLHISYRAVF